MTGHLLGGLNYIFCEPSYVFNIEMELRRGDTSVMAWRFLHVPFSQVLL